VSKVPTNNNQKRYKNKSWLKKQYWDKQLSFYKIANKCGVSNGTISYWMQKFNISRRSKSKAEIIDHNKGEIYKDKQWLKEKLIDEKVPPSDLANKLDISDSTIHKWIRHFSIKWRPYQNKEWLKTQLQEKQKSVKEIGKEWNRDPETIRNWVNKFNLKTPFQQRSKSDIAYSRFYSFYIKGAKKRDLTLKISQEDFKRITKKDC